MLIFKSSKDVKSRQLRGEQKRQKGCEEVKKASEVSLWLQRLWRSHGCAKACQVARMMRATTKFRYDAKVAEVASRCNRHYRRYRAESKSGGRTMAQESRGFGFTARASEVTEWQIKAE